MVTYLGRFIVKLNFITWYQLLHAYVCFHNNKCAWNITVRKTDEIDLKGTFGILLVFDRKLALFD